MFSVSSLLVIAALYLLLLFAISFASDKGWLPKRLIRHPFTYVLTLCVYASAWTIYASIGYAYQYGFNFLALFLGVSGLFLLGPVFLVPLLRLTRTYQLASLADLFAFRYRSRTVGALTTLLLLIIMLPMLAMQLQAVTTSIQILSDGASPTLTALVFCGFILVATLLFSPSRLTQRQKHEGLVAAIAFESLLKIGAFILVAVVGFFQVFHSPAGFEQWLTAHPDMVDAMYAPLKNGAWHSLIIAFFVSAVAMPHLFHMTFTQNLNPNNLVTASWALPLVLLVMALCIPFILWAALAGHATTQPAYHLIGVGMIGGPTTTLLAFIAGLTSASGLLVVALLALSSMCFNHLVMPFTGTASMDKLYNPLLWVKRLLILAILLLSYLFYVGVPANSLTQFGAISVAIALQVLPGMLGVLLWPGANRAGFITGLIAGFSIWLIALALPFIGAYPYDAPLLAQLHLDGGDNLLQLYHIGTVALLINSVAVIVISLVVRSRPEELEAAEACVLDSSRRSHRWALKARTVDDFFKALAVPLGDQTAEHELQAALDQLTLNQSETRPYALRRLRDQLESNISGLFGPSVARNMISTFLPYQKDQPAQPEDTQLIESRIEMYRDHLSGLAAELDSLRRFHRQTLLELPMGVISLSDDNEIIGWNRAMESLTSVSALDIVGDRLDGLPGAWASLLSGFLQQTDSHNPRCSLTDDTHPRWLNLHKSRIRGSSANAPSNGLVIVVEDITELHQLESHLTHNERLASIGRLAAGVAHEIGNPVTAIDCLAQNMEYDLPHYDLPPTDADEMASNLKQITEQTRRISRIVQSLITFSHSDQPQAVPQRHPVNLREIAEEAIGLLKLDTEYRDQQFDNRIDPALTTAGDSQRLLQVLINLLNNACDACHRKDAITLSGSKNNHTLVVDVEDAGEGIDLAMQERLFEPFVTSKPPGKGTGLGMSLVYSIMKEHGGSIGITSPVANDRGTSIRLTLPCFSDEGESASQ